MAKTKIGVRWFTRTGFKRMMDIFDKSSSRTAFLAKDFTVVTANNPDIYVSKDGDDTYGMGTKESPLLTITAAFALCTSIRTNVHVGPGVYSETNELTWPAVSGVKLMGSGKWTTEIELASGHGDDQVINVAPGAQSSTFEMWIMDMRINHDESGLDGILLNNTSMTKKLNVYLKAVGGDADSDSDKFITLTHGDTGNAIRVYWSGPRNGEVDGAIFWSAKNASDRLYIENAYLMGGIEFSGDNIAATLRLKDCVVKHEGVTGGHAATLVTTMSSFSLTGTTFAALDGDDIAGSFSGELILP